MPLFRRIKCTLDSAVHDNFYSSYVVLQWCHCKSCEAVVLTLLINELFIYFIRGATIVSMTVFAPRAVSGTILKLCSFRNSKFQKHKLDSAQNVTFFTGSSAHWTVLYMTISTFHTLHYNSVIDSFCSKSLKWDHTGVMLIQKFKISKTQLDSA
jgi:hypothetical protein